MDEDNGSAGLFPAENSLDLSCNGALWETGSQMPKQPYAIIHAFPWIGIKCCTNEEIYFHGIQTTMFFWGIKVLSKGKKKNPSKHSILKLFKIAKVYSHITNFPKFHDVTLETDNWKPHVSHSNKSLLPTPSRRSSRNHFQNIEPHGLRKWPANWKYRPNNIMFSKSIPLNQICIPRKKVEVVSIGNLPALTNNYMISFLHTEAWRYVSRNVRVSLLISEVSKGEKTVNYFKTKMMGR